MTTERDLKYELVYTYYEERTVMILNQLTIVH